MDDCLVIGGGVVGLSLAYELSGRGLQVRVVDKNAVGQEASWAGAGILPAAVVDPDHPVFDQLWTLSGELHGQWAGRLLQQTGIDNQYRACSQLYFAQTEERLRAVEEDIAGLRRRDVEVVDVTATQLRELEPALTGLANDTLLACYRVPGSAQLRNPRHLKALAAACRQQGVQILEHLEVRQVARQGGTIRHLETSNGILQADRYCFTAGAWTSGLVDPLGCELPIKPIRGQIVLLKTPDVRLRSIVYDKLRYLVPRDDGKILVGSTLEDVGFDKRTTASATGDLLRFAISVMPELSQAEVEKCWAGLRPRSADHMPFLGRLPNFDNGFVAAGHFRWGLYLSPATAVLMSDLICGDEPQLDLEPFRVGRQVASQP